VIALHNRSLGGIDGPEGVRVRVKRLRQAESIATKVQDLQTADPDVRLVVLGDFNAFEFTDGYVDAVSVIEGDFDPLTSLVCSEEVCLGDLVEPNLDSQVLGLDPGDRYSFIFRGNAQSLDQALTSVGLDAVMGGAEFGRGNADAAVDLINVATTSLRASDHDGLVLYFDSECPRQRKGTTFDNLVALGSTGDSHIDRHIEKAIDKIAKSLHSKHWVDGRHLTKKGKKVFDEEKKAVKELLRNLHHGVAPAVEDVLAQAVADLVSADEILARVAMDEAIAAAAAAGCSAPLPGPDCDKALMEIAKAEQEYAKALAEIANGKFDKAIDKFKKAWEKAQKAIEKLVP